MTPASTPGELEDGHDDELAPSGPYFTIEKDEADDFRARLFGGNGELVWMTEGYERKADADEAVALIRSTGVRHAPIRYAAPAGD